MQDKEEQDKGEQRQNISIKQGRYREKDLNKGNRP